MSIGYVIKGHAKSPFLRAYLGKMSGMSCTSLACLGVIYFSSSVSLWTASDFCGIFDHTVKLRDCVNKMNLGSGDRVRTS